MTKSNVIEKEFAENVRLAREQRGFSQAELARRAGLQASSISNFEHCQRSPSLANLYRLSEALNVPIDRLLGRTMDHATNAMGPKARELMEVADKLSDRDLQTVIGLAKEMARRK